MWLAVGADRAIVSHESALELHELSDVLPNAVHLLVSRDDRGIRPPTGVLLHTTSTPVTPTDVMVREGIRVTAPARSIVDAASAGTQPEQIELAVRQALARGIVTPTALLELAERRGRRVADLVQRAIEETAA
jgi:predicted transcriptional regulator of viral defense system